ncbi:MAG: ABC transporter ATP-binding protein [Ignavibacteria bacterium]
MKAISIKDLVKIYNPFSKKAVKALDNINLEIDEGKIFAFLGPNGAGKSTLFKIILGLINFTSGEVKLFGQDIREKNLDFKIGYLPEAFGANENFTAISFLKFFAEISGVTSDKLNKKVEETLEWVGLDSVRNQKIKTFSKGMLQRLLFAQAIIHQPELLLLDEPTDGLDPIGKKDFRKLLLKLKEDGTTIILNSHLLSEVELLADDVAILNKGKIVASGSLMNLLPQTQGFEIIVDQEPERLTFNGIELRLVKKKDELVILVNGIEELQNVATSLNNMGIKVLMIRPIKNTLEDVFFHYIGASEND